MAFVAAVQNVLLLAIGVLFYHLRLPTTADRWFTYAWVSVLAITACTLLGIAATAIVKNGTSAPAIGSPIAIVLQLISGCFLSSPACPVGCRPSPPSSR